MRRDRKRMFAGLTILAVGLWFGGPFGNSERVCKAAKKAEVRKIQLSKQQYVLEKGKTVKLSARIMPQKAKKTKVIWHSGNPKLLRVNKRGVVTAKAKKGKAVITAKAGKRKASCKITIGKPVTRIQASAMTMQIGEKKQLQVSVFPKKASIKTVRYQCNRPSVARISKNGTVLAKKKGSAVITIWAADCMKVSKRVQIRITDKSSEKNCSSEEQKDNASTASPTTVPTKLPVQPTDSPSAPPIEPTPADDIKATGDLTGIVRAKRDSMELKALEDAQVSVYLGEGKIREVNTSAEGKFEITGLDCDKIYTIVIQKEGFCSRRIENISVKQGVATTITETGALILLSQSVKLVSTDTDIVRIVGQVVKIPQDIESTEFLKVLYNPEGGKVSFVEGDQIQVQAEDETVTQKYPVQFIERETALVSGTDFTIDYTAETLQIISKIERKVEYRFSGDAVWSTLTKSSDTGVFEVLNLKNALDEATTLFVRKARNEGEEFASAVTVVELKRPQMHTVKYYQISCSLGYRYGIEVGKLNQTYEVYFSTKEIEDRSQIPESQLKCLLYTGTDSEGTYYESEKDYRYIYVRTVASDNDFASEWVRAEYKSRDNEFNFDDIP